MILWGAAPLVAYFSQRAEGAGVQTAFTLVVSALPLTIFLVSFVNKKAYWAITAFDMICGALSLIALIFLVATGNGIVALWLSIVADFFASLPTVIKSYKFPESETTISYVFEVIASIIVLLTVQRLVFVDYAFAVYVLLDCALIAAFLLRPRKESPRKATA